MPQQIILRLAPICRQRCSALHKLFEKTFWAWQTRVTVFPNFVQTSLHAKQARQPRCSTNTTDSPTGRSTADRITNREQSRAHTRTKVHERIPSPSQDAQVEQSLPTEVTQNPCNSKPRLRVLLARKCSQTARENWRSLRQHGHHVQNIFSLPLETIDQLHSGL